MNFFFLTLSSTQEISFNRDTLFVPFKAPVRTLAPSIYKLSNKLLSDSERASQTISAYSNGERTKDLNKTSSVQRLKLYFNSFMRFNFLEAFWWIFNICARQDKLEEDKVKPRCSWTVTSSIHNTIVQNQTGVKRRISFCRKTIDLVLVSFIVTNHRSAQSDIDVKSWLSLEVQLQGDWTFSCKKKSSANKQKREEIVAGRSLM